MICVSVNPMPEEDRTLSGLQRLRQVRTRRVYNDEDLTQGIKTTFTRDTDIDTTPCDDSFFPNDQGHVSKQVHFDPATKPGRGRKRKGPMESDTVHPLDQHQRLPMDTYQHSPEETTVKQTGLPVIKQTEFLTSLFRPEPPKQQAPPPPRSPFGMLGENTEVKLLAVLCGSMLAYYLYMNWSKGSIKVAEDLVDVAEELGT